MSIEQHVRRMRRMCDCGCGGRSAVTHSRRHRMQPAWSGVERSLFIFGRIRCHASEQVPRSLFLILVDVHVILQFLGGAENAVDGDSIVCGANGV